MSILKKLGFAMIIIVLLFMFWPESASPPSVDPLEYSKPFVTKPYPVLEWFDPPNFINYGKKPFRKVMVLYEKEEILQQMKRTNTTNDGFLFVYKSQNRDFSNYNNDNGKLILNHQFIIKTDPEERFLHSCVITSAYATSSASEIDKERAAAIIFEQQVNAIRNYVPMGNIVNLEILAASIEKPFPVGFILNRQPLFVLYSNAKGKNGKVQLFSCLYPYEPPPLQTEHN